MAPIYEDDTLVTHSTPRPSVVHVNPTGNGNGIDLRKQRGLKPLRIAIQEYLPQLRFWQLRAREAERQLLLARDKCQKIGARMRAAQKGVRDALEDSPDTDPA